MSEERALLVEGERERKVEQLRKAARTPRRRAALLLDARRGRLDKARRCIPCAIPREHQSRRRLPGDRVEHDRGHDSVAKVGCKAVRPHAAELASVRGDEKERVRRADNAGAGRCVSGDGARV